MKKNKFTENMWFRIIFIFSLICHSLAEDVILNLNTKRPISITSEKFLSFTLDPAWIFSGDLKFNFLSSNLEKSINIAKAFSPAYVRFAGTQSNSFTFENEQFLQDNQTISNQNFTENILNVINQWAEKSGLNLITCIGQQFNENSENGSQLWNAIAFSDQMGYNTSWQLGYECQSRCDFPGENLGQGVKHLRRILNEFPRYSTSLIVGPDVIEYQTKNQQQYLNDYFNTAGSALSSVTWHPDFDEISLNNDEVIIREENLLIEKKNLEKATGQSILEKPLWIAESKEEKCKNQFIGALVWARRLGNAAKVGAQVLMRQPDNSNLFKPTPDFWVSLLHKTLVGPEVFNLNVQSGNETHTQFFCQCTKSSLKYKKGSLTIFGINLTPYKIIANFKGLKIKEAHDYILLPGFDTSNRMFSKTVLLNNKLLELKNSNEIPDIEPIKRKDEKGVSLNLPSGGIGFWVIPNLKFKACRFHEEKKVDKQQVKILSHLLQKEEMKDFATEELIELSKELKSLLPDENKQVTLSKEVMEKKQMKRLKRDVENMDKLLNQEMFREGENNQQYRTIRKVKTPKNEEEEEEELPLYPEKVIIIDPDETIAKDEISIEDGSGAHVIDIVEKIPETNQYGKVKREYKIMEKNLQVDSNPTESNPTEPIPLVPVGAKPEINTKSSTEKISINREARANKYTKKIASLNSPNSSSPSRKRVRQIFPVMGMKAPDENKLLNPIPMLKLSPINLLPPLTINAIQLRQRAADALSKLRSTVQGLTNSLKTLRPFTVKRETSMEQSRNGELLQKLKESIENLKLIQTSNSLKNILGDRQLIEKSEEQLNKIKNNIRVSYDEMLDDYKSNSLDFLRKINDESSVKNLINTLSTVDSDLKTRFSNIFNSLKNIQQRNSFIKREIKLPKLSNLLKLIKNEDCDEEEFNNSFTKEVELLQSFTQFFINYLRNYASVFFEYNNPSEMYPSTKELIVNTLDDEESDELSSEEDENWNYKDNKYKRKSRSAKFDESLMSDYKIDENLINNAEYQLIDKNEEKYSRKRRDAENDDYTNLENDEVKNSEDSEKSSKKRRRKKKKKNKVNEPEYDMYSEDYPILSKDTYPMYLNYPYIHPLYDFLPPPPPPPNYENYHPNPTVQEFPNNYNFQFDHINPVPQYFPPVQFIRRFRRQANDNIIKTTEKNTINDNQVIDKNSFNENKKENIDLLENSENSLESSLINCPDNFITEKINDKETNVENSAIEIFDSDEIENSTTKKEITTVDSMKNNLESLMSMEKVYDKFIPSKEHRIHSRKMMPENENDDSTFFQDVTKTIENIFTYFSNMTH